MEFEDLCNIKLSLSLGCCVDKPDNYLQFNFQQKNLPSSKFDKLLPSLMLSSEVTKQTSRENSHFYGETQHTTPPQASSISAVSSFSNSDLKRERDVSDEVEVDKVSPKAHEDDQDEEVGVRKKLRLSKEQAVILEDSFKLHSTLNPKQKQELAKRLNLRPRQVEVWFQNRRARIKMKKTEVECELLKKYCETLTDENRRLNKELQELRALKHLSAPFYMQLPAAAATLSLCPSCEKISSSARIYN